MEPKPHLRGWNICEECLEKQPNYTTKEKDDYNIWDHLDDFLKVYEMSKKGEWHWFKNWECKYVDLRIDMRDGGCLISASGKRIGPDALAWQYDDEENPRPET